MIIIIVIIMISDPRSQHIIYLLCDILQNIIKHFTTINGINII